MLVDKIYSKIDATIKYIFKCQEQEVEFSLIRKGDGKDIICTPTQTSCKMGCSFCFLTGSNLPVINLTTDDICKSISYIIKDKELPSWSAHTLLISYMGSGEPLANRNVVIEASQQILKTYYDKYFTVRFAIASIIPSLKWMQEFTDQIQEAKLPMKFHFSLHSPSDEIRRWLMPSAAEIKPSVEALENYRQKTGNLVEIHYSLNDSNDDDRDLVELRKLLWSYRMPIKFLAFKERPEAKLEVSQRVDRFRKSLEASGIAVEYYDPPGSDIGASCGQFLTHLKKSI